MHPNSIALEYRHQWMQCLNVIITSEEKTPSTPMSVHCFLCLFKQMTTKNSKNLLSVQSFPNYDCNCDVLQASDLFEFVVKALLFSPIVCMNWCSLTVNSEQTMHWLISERTQTDTSQFINYFQQKVSKVLDIYSLYLRSVYWLYWSDASMTGWSLIQLLLDSRQTKKY